VLRRADNVEVYRPETRKEIKLVKRLAGVSKQFRYPVIVSTPSESIAVLPGDVFDTWADESDEYPVCVGSVGERGYWLFRGRWYWDNDDLTADEIYALIVSKDQRNRQRINRARTMIAMQETPSPSIRGAIPDGVKQFVWARDGARCRRCGSNIELQFDHIIPVAYGGASTPENLQILCGPCNRGKGASVT
jgi:5-methylcytosine-specific restriction endonuclease McrA